MFKKFEQNIIPSSKRKPSHLKESNLFSKSKKGISVNKGDEMGRFNMGSTVVLIFEAGPNFVVEANAGDRVVYGQRIGSHVPHK